MTKATKTREWLAARGRDGIRRIERLGWKRIARIYGKNAPNSPERKMILAECRRLGYTPRVILGLHG